MNNGYIKLYRKLLDSQIFTNAALLKVFIWCLLKANHKGRWVPVQTGRGNTEVYVGPGKFIYGRNASAKSLLMKPDTVRFRMSKLQDMQILTIQATTHYSIISINNWNTYQVTEKLNASQITRQLPGNYQPTTTNKNDKNVKEKRAAKKQAVKTLPPDSIQFTETHRKIANQSNASLQDEWDKYCDWAHAKGEKRVDHNRAFNNWLRKCQEINRGGDNRPLRKLKEVE